MPKQIDEKLRERMRDMVVTRVRPRFEKDYGDRWQAAAARALEVSQSSINRLVRKLEGGTDLAEKIGKFLNMDPKEVLYGEAPENQVRQLRDLPGYAEAAEAVKAMVALEGGVPGWALEAAGDSRITPVPSKVTPSILLSLARSRAEESSESGGGVVVPLRPKRPPKPE